LEKIIVNSEWALFEQAVCQTGNEIISAAIILLPYSFNFSLLRQIAHRNNQASGSQKKQRKAQREDLKCSDFEQIEF